LLHIGNFFDTYYPNVEWTCDWGVSWGEYWTKLATQLAGGAPLEMVWMHDSRVQTFASRNLLLPMDDWLSAFTPPGWPDEFYPSQVAAFNYQNKQWAFPYDWAPGGWYVNLDKWEEAGLGDLPTEDWTWEQTLEAAKAMTKDGDGDGVIDQWGLGNITTSGSGGAYWIVKSFGGDYWDETVTQSKFDDPNTIAAFQFLADLMWDSGVHPTAGMYEGIGMDAELAFASGKIGLHYGLNDISFRIGEASGGEFEWTVAPTPTGPAGRFQFSGGSAFAIPNTCEQPDMAYELVSWVLANPDNLPTTATMGGALVSNMNFAEFGLPPADLGISDAFQHAFVELGARDATYPAYHPKYQEWDSSVYTVSMDPLWVGEQRDAAVACAQAHEGTNALLSS
jgi:multiple sugar transport system substrate-binding protein